MGLTRIRAEQISDIDFKQAVRVCATTNISLSGGAPNSVDDVNLSAGDRILVTGQTNAVQNGIYQVQTVGAGSNGTWVRATDANAATGEVESGLIVQITEGTANGDTQWVLKTDDPIIVGTTELVFERNVGGKVTVSGSPPNEPKQGDYWIDSDTAVQYIYFNDGDSTQWAEMESQYNYSYVGGNADFTQIASNVLPFSTAAYTLGNVNNQWKDAHLSNTLFVSTVTSSVLSASSTITATGNVTGGNLITAGLVSSTGNVTGGNLISNGQVIASYNPASAVGVGITVSAANTQGGTGYADFLRATNSSGGASNTNKTFRLNSTGGLEIINSAYDSVILSLTNAGGFSVTGSISVAGKQAVNGPAFSAYPSSGTAQTITSGSQQKILFGSEEYDTNSNFASSTFTPTVEGYYQLNAAIRFDGGGPGTGECMIVIYKNGAEHKRSWNQSGTAFANSFWTMSISSLVYANGTGDYFEIYAQQSSGADRTVQNAGSGTISWFNGSMMRGG
jgi:hypothetical protein